MAVLGWIQKDVKECYLAERDEIYIFVSHFLSRGNVWGLENFRWGYDFRQSSTTEFMFKQELPHQINTHDFNVHIEMPAWALAVSGDMYGILKTGKRKTTVIPIVAGRKLPVRKGSIEKSMNFSVSWESGNVNRKWIRTQCSPGNWGVSA